MPDTQLFLPALLYSIVNWAMIIGFLVFWARNSRDARPFLTAGLLFVAVYFTLETIVLLSIGAASLPMSLPWIATTLTMTTIRVLAFSVVGLLLAQRLNEAFAEGNPSGGRSGLAASYGASLPSGQAIRFAFAALIFMLAYSAILFRTSGAGAGISLQQLADQSFDLGVTGIFAVAAVGFAEEIVFRLGLQNALTYRWRRSVHGHYWSVVVTSAFWSVGHMGAVDPDWVKIAQIFVFGLILGHMNRRFGVIPCIITHSSFNVIIATFATELLGTGILPA